MKTVQFIKTVNRSRNIHTLAGIADMTAANCYLQEVYMPAEFMQPAAEEGTAFVPSIDGQLTDILCKRYERVVGHDNSLVLKA